MALLNLMGRDVVLISDNRHEHRIAASGYMAVLRMGSRGVSHYQPCSESLVPEKRENTIPVLRARPSELVFRWANRESGTMSLPLSELCVAADTMLLVPRLVAEAARLPVWQSDGPYRSMHKFAARMMYPEFPVIVDGKVLGYKALMEASGE